MQNPPRCLLLIGLGFGLLAVGGCSELNLVECEDGSSCPSSHRCERGEQSFICLAEDAAVRCQKTYPEDLLDQLEDPNRADEYILIGTIFDRSDSLMKKYEPIVEFALKQANQAGGVAGRQFGAVFCTVESDVALNYDGHTLSTVAAGSIIEKLGWGSEKTSGISGRRARWTWRKTRSRSSTFANE